MSSTKTAPASGRSAALRAGGCIIASPRSAADLARLGAALHIYRGAAGALVPKLAVAADATAVFWSRRYGAAERAVDTAVKSALRDAGIAAESCNDHLLFEPWEVKTKAGEPFKVFTPFWRARSRARRPRAAAAAARKSLALPRPPARPSPHARQPEPAAHQARLGRRPARDLDARRGRRPRSALRSSSRKRLAGYAASRDRPDLAGTSRLSPHLRFGEISPRQVWHAAAARRAMTAALRTPTSRNSSPRSAGASSPITCCSTIPTSPPPTSTSRFDAFPWRADTNGAARLAARPHRLSPSSMPACASSGTPAACTTACA